MTHLVHYVCKNSCKYSLLCKIIQQLLITNVSSSLFIISRYVLRRATRNIARRSRELCCVSEKRGKTAVTSLMTGRKPQWLSLRGIRTFHYILKSVWNFAQRNILWFDTWVWTIGKTYGLNFEILKIITLTISMGEIGIWKVMCEDDRLLKI